MFKRSLMGAVCAGCCIAGAYSHTANAQAPERWTGLYGGGHIGGGWADNADATLAPANAGTQATWGQAIAIGGLSTNYSNDPDGLLAGLLMGYNWAFGSFLIGIEADVSLTSIQDSQNNATRIAPLVTIPIAEFDTDIPWIATLRGRLGVLASPDVLLYATGGLAIAEVDQSYFFQDANRDSFSGRSSDTKTGYAVGGGMEWALSGNWSLKGDYLYISLDDNDFRTGPGGVGGCNVAECLFDLDTDDIELHTVRLGVNYKFGHPPPAEPLK